MKIQKPISSRIGENCRKMVQKPGPVCGFSRTTSMFLLISWSSSFWSVGPTTWPSVPSVRRYRITLVLKVLSSVNTTERMRPASTSCTKRV